jgi:putative ABC transport system ATP-binding protein
VVGELGVQPFEVVGPEAAQWHTSDRRCYVEVVSHDDRLREVADRVLWLEDGAFGELEYMPVDPVCGMAVDRSTAVSAEVDGELWWFCSGGCSTDFRNRHQDAAGSTP